MVEGRCPSCGTKVQSPEGQPLPRCRHCWSPLVVEAPLTPQIPSAPTNGLDDLFAALEQESDLAVDGTIEPSGCCRWCGAVSESGMFCSQCGLPLLDTVL